MELSCARGRLATGGNTSPSSWRRGSRSGKPGGSRDAALSLNTETEIYGKKSTFSQNLLISDLFDRIFSPLRSWSHQDLSIESTYYLVVLTDSKYKSRRAKFSILVLSHFTIILLASCCP